MRSRFAVLVRRCRLKAGLEARTTVVHPSRAAARPPQDEERWGFKVAAIVTLALLSGGAALAQDVAPPTARVAPGRITVIGRATLDLPPDRAAVSISVVTRGATPAAALDANSAAARKIVDGARALGVEGRDVATTAVNLSQAYKTVRDPVSGSSQQPDGFEASNSVRVRLADLGKLGQLIRATLDGGANRIGGVSFELADPAAAERDADAAATRDALARADAIAKAAGVALGPITRIGPPGRVERSDAFPPTPAPMRLAKAMGGQAVPLEADTVSVAAEIEIEWALKTSP